MKKLILLLCLVVSGCGKSDFDKERGAREYLEAGMFDEAEKYYQDLILSEDQEHRKELWKDQLLQLYLKTNQLGKADQYMTFVVFSDGNDRLDYEEMSRNHSEVAKALADAKRFARSYFHYKASAEYIERSSPVDKAACKENLIYMSAKAAESAKKADLINELLELSVRIRPLITDEKCLANKSVQAQLVFFPEIHGYEDGYVD